MHFRLLGSFIFIVFIGVGPRFYWSLLLYLYWGRATSTSRIYVVVVSKIRIVGIYIVLFGPSRVQKVSIFNFSYTNSST